MVPNLQPILKAKSSNLINFSLKHAAKCNVARTG